MRVSSVVHRFRGSGGGTRGGCREDVMRALLKRFVKGLSPPEPAADGEARIDSFISSFAFAEE